MTLQEINELPYNLVAALDRYDFTTSISMCLVYDNGSLENIRNKGLFPSLCMFSYGDRQGATDFDVYAIHKDTRLAVINSEVDGDIITSTVTLSKNSEYLKDAVLEELKYRTIEGKTINYTVVIAENNFEMTEDDLLSVKSATDSYFEEHSNHIVNNTTKELFEKDDFLDFLKEAPFDKKLREVEIKEEDIPF